MGRRNFHRRLFRFEGEQRIVHGDHVAGLHMDFDDIDFFVCAEIGYRDLDDFRDRRGTVLPRLIRGLFRPCRRPRPRGCGFLLDRRFLHRLGGRRRNGLQRQNIGPRRHPITEIDGNALDHAGHGRGDFHGGLVAFKHEQGIVFLHRLADRNWNLDDFHIVRVAEFRHFDDFRSQLRPLQSRPDNL